MKTKLLKKVKKRFEIFHLPNGFIRNGHRYEYNVFKLIDHNKSDLWDTYVQLRISRNDQKCAYANTTLDSEADCIDYLKAEIINRLRSEGHTQRKDKIIQRKVIKVWHI